MPDLLVVFGQAIDKPLACAGLVHSLDQPAEKVPRDLLEVPRLASDLKPEPVQMDRPRALLGERRGSDFRLARSELRHERL